MDLTHQLAGELPGPTCLWLPSAGVRDVQPATPGFLHGRRGSGLSSVGAKHITGFSLAIAGF